MTASQQCKAAGLKSLAQLSEITNTPRGTLNEWHSSNQDRFTMAIDAALYRLAKSESLQG